MQSHSLGKKSACGRCCSSAESSEYYSGQEEQFHRNHLCWNLPEDDGRFIAVDLWTTIVDNCCLVYERKTRKE